MDALKNDSVMNAITRDFRQLLEDFQFLTFYETQPLGCFGMVSVPSLLPLLYSTLYGT